MRGLSGLAGIPERCLAQASRKAPGQPLEAVGQRAFASFWWEWRWRSERRCLASAGLLLHSFVKVMRADRGYQVERVLAVDLSLFGQRYSTGESRVAFYRELAGNVRALPGILAAGAISDLPAAAGSSGASQTIFHATDTNFQSLVLARPVAMIRSVTAGYFAASGTTLRAGRFFTDHEQVPVALISESLGKPPLAGGNARRPLWAARSARAMSPDR